MLGAVLALTGVLFVLVAAMYHRMGKMESRMDLLLRHSHGDSAGPVVHLSAEAAGG